MELNDLNESSQGKISEIETNDSFFSEVLVMIFQIVFFAFIAGTIIGIPALLLKNQSSGFFMFGGVGVIIAAPLLITVFLPWYYFCKNRSRFLLWVSTPTITSAIYPMIFNPSAGIDFIAIFTATGFLTSVFMMYAHKK